MNPWVRTPEELGALARALAPARRLGLDSESDGLHHHIAKEEDGLFPASLTALDGDEWDAAMAGWRAAHPGKTMIGG